MKCLADWERQVGEPFALLNEAPFEKKNESLNDDGDKNDSDETGEN